VITMNTEQTIWDNAALTVKVIELEKQLAKLLRKKEA